MKKQPKIAMSEWMELLESTLVVKPDVVPEGFMRTEQLAQLIGKSKSVAFKKIQLLILRGKVECKKFKVSNGKYVRSARYYRIKK